jgi:hypothetical protein
MRHRKSIFSTYKEADDVSIVEARESNAPAATEGLAVDELKL